MPIKKKTRGDQTFFSLKAQVLAHQVRQRLYNHQQQQQIVFQFPAISLLCKAYIYCERL
jgi:hypothetical protein